MGYEPFATASEASRATLARRGQRRVLHAGETLFHLGDPADELFLIQEGRAKLWRAAESGVAVTLAYVYAGELIGLVAVMRDRPQRVTATAVTDLTATVMPAALIRDLLARDPALAAGIADALAGRAELISDRMEEMSYATADQRVARTLVRLATEIGTDGDGVSLHLAVNQHEVAELAQTTVPTVSRLMKRWRGQGMVASGRGEIVILGLADLALVGGMDG